MVNDTWPSLLNHQCRKNPDSTWLREREGEGFSERSWSEGRAELNAVAAWLEARYGEQDTNMAILSRNRAHWVMADLAIVFSGNVSVPLFTTAAASTVDYILGFTDTRVLVLGEADNWEAVSRVVPDTTEIITLPGVKIDLPHTRWEDIVAECTGLAPSHEAVSDELISIVFTSGTTGVPKGVMQSHESMIIPMMRGKTYFQLREHPRFFSYLPMAHIAERQLVMTQALIHGGMVTFNESLPHLLRDMAETKPNFFFGAPRVWEQIQQGVIAKFGSQQVLDAALAADAAAVGKQVRTALGLDEADFMLTAAAPTPPALIHWYEKLGICLVEGWGQTEMMAGVLSTPDMRKVGSVGRVPGDVELKFSEEGELLFKAPGTAIGYYRMPEKAAETFDDGWVHSGDKGYMDEDGFVYLTGRVKDYFKTIQGKFVAPVPIENAFAKSKWAGQACLLGRGYSKTVMACVLSEIAQQQDRQTIENDVRRQVAEINDAVEKHARIGAVMISTEPWTIENEILTPTLKIRREEVEKRFGERARELAHEAAVAGEIRLEWV
jgi:long-chain acyl-CoA synthetase